jgi:Tfp pilus assembly protein PilO
MKFRKEHAAIVFLLAAFIVFFMNVVVVLGDKKAQIETLKKENDALRKAYSALEQDHTELRKEKAQTIEKLRKQLQESGPETGQKGSADK